MTQEHIAILLVDDEKRFVDTLAQRLSMRGFSPRTVYCGEDALQAVTEPTDVIVLDLRMAGMDGFQVLNAVRRSNPEVKIVILTGHGGDAEEQTAYRMGAHSFLRKPVNIEELLRTIRAAHQENREEVRAYEES